jgi:hypothetical protein
MIGARMNRRRVLKIALVIVAVHVALLGLLMLFLWLVPWTFEVRR